MYDYLILFNEDLFYKFMLIEHLCMKGNIPIDIEL